MYIYIYRAPGFQRAIGELANALQPWIRDPSATSAAGSRCLYPNTVCLHGL